MRKVKKLALFLTFFSFVIMTCFSNVVFAASIENDATDEATTESVADEVPTENDVADEATTEIAADETTTENDVADEAKTESVADEVPTESVADEVPTESVADEATTESAVIEVTSTENTVAAEAPASDGVNVPSAGIGGSQTDIVTDGPPEPTQEEIADAEAIIKKIAPDLKNAVFKMKKPTNTTDPNESLSIDVYVQNLLQEQKYEINASPGMSFVGTEPSYDYNICEIYIGTSYIDENGYEQPKSLGTYTINVTYDEPKSDSVAESVVGSYKLNDFDEEDLSSYYLVEDLSLINYYLTGDNSELWNPGAPGRALKFSTINSVTNGSNVSYYLVAYAGMQYENAMYESANGPMSIFYNGYSYASEIEGIYLRRVIYIPQDTDETKGAYIAAAQKRIDEYLGDSSDVVVSDGDLISSIPLIPDGPDYINPVDSNDNIVKDKGNYYNIKVGNRTYKFYIVKASDDKLKEPTYLGTDIESKVEITSEDSAIPLDTSLTVKDVTESSTKDKIGTENYKSYDISLYSNAKDQQIKKINGKFNVKIPVPAELNGKNLVVYYIPTTGEMEEHEVTIEDGYAIFTTDHFSTYTLAEKVSKKAETPAPDAEISKKPQAPEAEIAEKPQTPQTQNKNDASPTTGDASPIIPVVFVLFASLVGGLVLMIKKSES